LHISHFGIEVNFRIWKAT